MLQISWLTLLSGCTTVQCLSAIWAQSGCHHLGYIQGLQTTCKARLPRGLYICCKICEEGVHAPIQVPASRT